ncbi:MAG: hypothetical protein WC861_05875 [Candidatus Micrarchaeia archaeon]|jgi:hypothetical protein
MLNPLVYVKVVRARNAYLRAGNGKIGMAREKRLDIVGDRYCFYKCEGMPNDASRILNLATMKRNATGAEKGRLEKLRKEILDEPCLAEKAIAV